MTTEIATTNTAISTQQHNQSLSDAGLDVSDIKPGYISIQQKMSKAVDQGICKAGDILETPINVILGGEGKPIEVLPIFTRKEWVSYYKDQKENKPFRKEPFGPANSHWKYNEMIDKREVKNELVIIWYVLPPGDGTLPCQIHFRGMSGRTGNNVGQMVARVMAAGKSSFSKLINLDSVKESNDKGTFFVFKASFGRDATPVELANAQQWQDQFKKKPVATVEDDSGAAF